MCHNTLQQSNVIVSDAAPSSGRDTVDGRLFLSDDAFRLEDLYFFSTPRMAFDCSSGDDAISMVLNIAQNKCLIPTDTS